MNTSIIIVTFNRRLKLMRVLKELLPQMIEEDQLVIVDDGSTDGTEHAVRELAPDVTYVKIAENEGYRLSTRINQGLEAARHDMIWRLDSDCAPHPDALGLFKEVFRPDRIVAGAIQYQAEDGKITHPDQPWRMTFVQSLEHKQPSQFRHWQQTGELVYPALCFGGNICFSKSTALEFGGFDSEFDGAWGAEDAWFADRLMVAKGVKLLYTPGVAVVHQWHPEGGDHRRGKAFRRNFELWRSKSEELRGMARKEKAGLEVPVRRSLGEGVWRPEGVEGKKPPEDGEKYLLLSITGPEMVNAGNLVVELALLGHLPPPTLIASVFRRPTQEAIDAIRNEGCTVAICSGTTVYSDGTPLDAWAAALGDIPLVTIAGCFWYPDRRPAPTLAAAHMRMTARDPYTRDAFADQQSAPYVGCPTLLLKRGHDALASGRRLGLGFHRRSPEIQVELFKKLIADSGKPATIFVQERHEFYFAKQVEGALLGGADVKVVDLAELRTLRQWEDSLESLSHCISGRLHQVLPAAALGVPSLLIAPSAPDLLDTRYTLFEDLDLPSAALDEIPVDQLADRCGLCSKNRVGELTATLSDYLKGVFDGVAAEK